MKEFKDSKGRPWKVEVTVAAIMRVKNETDFDLLGAPLHEVVEQLCNDPVKLCVVIYSLCRPQFTAAEVADEDFFEAMAGDPVEHAALALIEELTDFTPNPTARANLRVAMEKAQTLTQRKRELVAQMLQERTDREIEAELQKFGDSFGAAPGSAASTPGPAPSAN